MARVRIHAVLPRAAALTAVFSPKVKAATHPWMASAHALSCSLPPSGAGQSQTYIRLKAPPPALRPRAPGGLCLAFVSPSHLHTVLAAARDTCHLPWVRCLSQVPGCLFLTFFPLLYVLPSVSFLPFQWMPWAVLRAPPPVRSPGGMCPPTASPSTCPPPRHPPPSFYQVKAKCSSESPPSMASFLPDHQQRRSNGL